MKGNQAKANRRQIPAQHKVELLVGKHRVYLLTTQSAEQKLN
jgi:hypothetical protein